MIVVSDTSPLNYLILIGQAHLLPDLFHRVMAPPAVVAELRHPDSPDLVKAWAASPPDWLEVLSPSLIDFSIELGRGEVEAISLAKEVKADAVLIDERKAVRVAKKLGLQVMGTLGILGLAAEKRLLDLGQAIAALRQTTFRGPEELMEELLRIDANRRTEQP